MKSVWRLAMAIAILWLPARVEAAVFPGYEELSTGVPAIRLLPGSGHFVFSMYGAPGELSRVRELVGVMRERGLGNGFDPGPGPSADAGPVFEFLAENRWPTVFYPGGEMQIQGGRAVFGGAEEAVLAPMDRAGLFAAYQLGEWGYYFHNLAMQESWWRSVYGADFDRFKHLMKPAGLAGYDTRPADKRACYAVVKDYFQSRSRDLLGRVISVTGHSHYEAYAAEWGARCVGLEVGEGIAFTQSKLAFARGASRARDVPWSVQVSPWFGRSVTTSGPLRTEGGIARGLNAGHSLSFYERMWLHGWFSGAAMVTPENSIAIFFEKAEAPWTLTEHGRKAAEVFGFMQAHERGVPYAPVAIVLDEYAGYNGFMDKPWGILEPTAGDRELRDLFDTQLFPGADHIHARPDPENPEASYLRPTPYGEMFDVQLTHARAEVLSAYPVIVLAGDIEFDAGFVRVLEEVLARGRRLLISGRHREALGGEFARLAAFGSVEVIAPWENPATGRLAAIENERLQQLAAELLPVRVTGESVQFAVNRTPRGWVIELINNGGVRKHGDQPAVIDPAARIRVVVEPRIKVTAARAWRSGEIYSNPARIEVELGPGAVEFVEWIVAP